MVPKKSLMHDDIDKFPNDWSRDGKYILYTNHTDLWFVNLPDLKKSLFLKAPSVLRNGQFSPDGKCSRDDRNQFRSPYAHSTFPGYSPAANPNF